jgi:hypothetical protein
LQVGGVEAFGEPAEDRGEQGHRLLRPALLSAQAGEARGGAQFPGLGVLPARDVDALLDGRLGLVRRAGAGEQGLAPEPMELRFKRRRSPIFSTAFSPAVTDASAASGLPLANCASAWIANSICWNVPVV